MISGSLGIRPSGSYGSLQSQHIQNGLLPIQTTSLLPGRKPSKMLKDKERIFYCICRFAPKKKFGMLLLGAVSAAVFLWVLLVGKVGGAQESGSDNIQLNRSLNYSYVERANIRATATVDGNNLGGRAITSQLQPPLPPVHVYFEGYTLPPGNPCEHFRLPPPPADPKRTGPRACPVCYLPMKQVLELMPKAPSFSPILKNLTYAHKENLTKIEVGGSEFGGHISLSQRNNSYDIRETMTVPCGFVRGNSPGRGTGFDIDEVDLLQMESCKGIVVASAIFGAFDLIRQPQNTSDYAKRNVCFFIFVDEETESFLKNSSALDSEKKSGLWRIVVVHNLPYTDPRRNGKIPKLLLHRLFPNACYSLWIDGKLQLVVDPYQVLERFLWRKNASFAISKHYSRFDVFEEAEANKAAGKYDNASIDYQIKFYKKEGLTPYSAAKLPIISDVPEGCVIIREHTPISNLFTCLWFNEVDIFTSRDQLSFSTVRDKIWAKTDWTVNMFLDCERRNFVLQGYHRDVLERSFPPPPPVVSVIAWDEKLKKLPELNANIHLSNPATKDASKRSRNRKSRHHHRKVDDGKDWSSS